MQNRLGICSFFRGTGSSETSWVVVLLVASFPSVGHGQAHVSEASSLVLVLQEPSAEVWLRSAAVGGHPSLRRRQAAPQSRRREKSSPEIPQAEVQARSPHRLAHEQAHRHTGTQTHRHAHTGPSDILSVTLFKPGGRAITSPTVQWAM